MCVEFSGRPSQRISTVSVVSAHLCLCMNWVKWTNCHAWYWRKLNFGKYCSCKLSLFGLLSSTRGRGNVVGTTSILHWRQHSSGVQWPDLSWAIGNESVPIQLAQCRFPGLAISNAEIQIHFHIKYTEPILSNSTRKLLRFEITKILIAV